MRGDQSVMSRTAIRPLLFLLLLSAAATGQRTSSRAINSTGLWSKYNLVVKPELLQKTSSAAVTPATTPVSSTTNSPSSAAPRWEEEEEYGQDIPDDEHEFDDSEEDQEEDEEEEDEQVYVPHTTQRSKGDSGKRRRPTSSSNHHKTSKHTRKGYKGTKGLKGFKKLKKYMFPLLIAYKLKFFTLIPLLLGGLVLIVATTGFAGFFFALFAVGVGLKKE